MCRLLERLYELMCSAETCGDLKRQSVKSITHHLYPLSAPVVFRRLLQSISSFLAQIPACDLDLGGGVAVAPEYPDELLALLRLPLVSKHDVLALIKEPLASGTGGGGGAGSVGASGAISSTSPRGYGPVPPAGASHSRSNSNVGGGRGGAAPEEGDVDGAETTAQSRLLPADCIGRLLTVVARGKGRGRLEIPPAAPVERLSESLPSLLLS